MSVDVAAVGARVRTMRGRLRWSGQELARRAGVDKTTVYALERGTADGANLRTLTGLAAAFEVPVGVLLGEQDPPLHWPVDRVFWAQVRREVAAIRGELEGVA